MKNQSYLGFSNLLRYGVCVIPVTDENVLERGFDAQLFDQPELVQPNGELIQAPYVGGGFSAFGHASSFHTPFVRELRTTIRQLMIDAIQSGEIQLPTNLIDGNIEIIPDRQCFRPAGFAPTKEGWHRDMSPTKSNRYVKSEPNDLIFGGWVNCNVGHSQHFMCVPESHYTDNTGDVFGTGFKPLSKIDAKECKRLQVLVEIPAGHAIIFIQDLIHCVNATKLQFDMRRVYISTRITEKHNTRPLIIDIVDRLKCGDVLPLKSGQIPRMYPKMWPVFWPDKLILLSTQFPESMKEQKRITSKRLQTEGTYSVLLTIAPVVADIVPYSETELMMYLPQGAFYKANE